MAESKIFTVQLGEADDADLDYLAALLRTSRSEAARRIIHHMREIAEELFRKPGLHLAIGDPETGRIEGRVLLGLPRQFE